MNDTIRRVSYTFTHGGQAIGSTVAAAPRLAWRWGPRPVNDQIEHLVRRAPARPLDLHKNQRVVPDPGELGGEGAGHQGSSISGMRVS